MADHAALLPLVRSQLRGGEAVTTYPDRGSSPSDFLRDLRAPPTVLEKPIKSWRKLQEVAGPRNNGGGGSTSRGGGSGGAPRDSQGRRSYNDDKRRDERRGQEDRSRNQRSRR